jgi:hypothetical protein
VQLNHPDIQEVLVTKEQIRDRVAELAAEIDSHYRDKDVLLIGILKGAVPFMADISRAMQIPTKQDWMAVSSYDAVPLLLLSASKGLFCLDACPQQFYCLPLIPLYAQKYDEQGSLLPYVDQCL